MRKVNQEKLEMAIITNRIKGQKLYNCQEFEKAKKIWNKANNDERKLRRMVFENQNY